MARVVALIARPAFWLSGEGRARGGWSRGRAGKRRDRTRERLADAPAVLVVDLVDDDLDGAALVESWVREGVLGQTRTLGFYSHVDARRASAPSRLASIWWSRVRAWPARVRRSSAPGDERLAGLAGGSVARIRARRRFERDQRTVRHPFAHRHTPADALEDGDADHPAVAHDQRG